ncbi:cysteine-rich receptor-like protein kinase 10 [Amborella trichopoda]|nr:cysteine-rich receptor-like protein kinase 10 [Amborella trichopoda]|eukprot:XP_020521615.1 cysteine-rich receptor-like protein kinase 10 [Amborella trichopoda]
MCGWLDWKKWTRKKEGDDEVAEDIWSLFFDLNTLKAATNDFSEDNRLGKGGFGPVYKGRMENGQEIAVKKLSLESRQGLREFVNEIKLLLKVQHRNLVLLLGCCVEGGEKMLVYEYLPNKSLDKYVFDKNRSILLNWPKRFEIILGVARGLLYLHEEASERIIHRDIKASNILLDNQMVPKISDFGLARLFPGDESHVSTFRISGTHGYMAPEYALHGFLSVKSDVFSFGVLVLEIVSGRKSFDKDLDEESQELLGYSWNLWGEGRALELADPNLGSFASEEISRSIQIGLLCCQSNVNDRPTMSSVLLMLSGHFEELPKPGKPGLQGRIGRFTSSMGDKTTKHGFTSSMGDKPSFGTSSGVKVSHSLPESHVSMDSVNDISTSFMHGRMEERLLLSLLFLSLLNPSTCTDPQWVRCDNSQNYTSTSPFSANLAQSLRRINESTAHTGFAVLTHGSGDDSVTTLAQCESDLGFNDCQQCITDATAVIRQRCPNQKVAQVWYELCTLRYSHENFTSQPLNGVVYFVVTVANTTDPDSFNSVLGHLLGELSDKASEGGSRFAAGSSTVSDFQSVYGLVQCTRDLSQSDCKTCFEEAVAQIARCCAGRVSALIGSGSCVVRFGSSLFYNWTAVEAAPPTLPPPPVRVAPPPVEIGGGGGSNNRIGAVVGVAVAVAVAVGAAVFLGFLCVMGIRKRRKKNRIVRKRRKVSGGAMKREDGDEVGEEESVFWKLSTLKLATDKFSDENTLGSGGFGAVYKGRMRNGTEIAVKRLAVGSNQGIKEFKNEVKLLLKAQHRNLVRLLGCCMEGGEKMLIYEYLPNKSLDKYLFDKRLSAILDWPKRWGIILGVARGLVYLHEESVLTIIHRDIKATNILLDHTMSPKISDFGLATLIGGEGTQVKATGVAGTFGYMAPEYALNGILSPKCDVFSFGVLLLEILSGRKNYDEYLDESCQELLQYASKLYKEGKLLQLMDVNIGSYPQGDVLRCIKIGLLCCQTNVTERPTMASVVLMLSNSTMTTARPGLIGYNRGNKKPSSLPSRNRHHVSRNSVTLSSLAPR